MSDRADLYVDVVSLISRQNFGIDERDLEICRDTWTEDGSTVQVLDGQVYRRLDGRAANLRYLEDLWAVQPRGRRHVATNVWLARVDAAEIEVVSYLMMVAGRDSPPALVTAGWYRDVIVREPDGLRFRIRTLHLDAPTGNAELVR